MTAILWALVPLGAVLAGAALRLRHDRQRKDAGSSGRFLASLLRNRQGVRRATLAELLATDDLLDRMVADAGLSHLLMAEPDLVPLPVPPVVHYWPALDGDGTLDCCGADPFQPGQSITIDPAKVTCAGGEGR